MKKSIVFLGFSVFLLILVGVTVGLVMYDMPNEDNSAQEETVYVSQVNDGTNLIAIEGYNRFIVPSENVGVTSANIRLFIEDNERTRQWNHAYMLLDLSHISHYHEFILREDAPRFIFTIETTINDFRFLSIRMNEAFFEEDRDEAARRYTIQKTLYIIDELTPKVPFVVRGTILGSAFASHGFSFLDENETTRYFSLESCGKTERIFIAEF